MPTRDNGRGSFVIDRRVPGVGRIKRASGTTDKTTFKRIVGMLDQLQARGRLDLLEAVRDGVVTPLQLWDAYRRDDLDRLPTAETVAPLWTPDGTGAVERWLSAWTKSQKHKDSTAVTFTQLAKLAPQENGAPCARVGELPSLLAKYRAYCEANSYGRAFNLARSHAQAFLRDTLSRRHRLWQECANLPILPVNRREGNPLPVAAFVTLLGKLAAVSPEHARVALMMAATGMGPSEAWGPFRAELQGVRVDGTKREGRKKRWVPRLFPVEFYRPPQRHERTFANTLGAASGDANEPYDMRRTFSHWMEEAQIPRARRKLYMGHRGGDVTDLYERHEVVAYLAADALKMRALVADALDPLVAGFLDGSAERAHEPRRRGPDRQPRPTRTPKGRTAGPSTGPTTSNTTPPAGAEGEGETT